MKIKGNKTLYYMALVAYALLLWFACIMLAVLVGFDSSNTTILYAFFIAFVMFFLWSKKYIAKWFEVNDKTNSDD